MNDVKMNAASVLSSIVNSYVPGYTSNIVLHENDSSVVSYYNSVGYNYYIDCVPLKDKEETGLRFKFTIKNTQTGSYIVWFEQPNSIKDNLFDVVNKIRKTIQLQCWPQDLVDKMFKTRNVDIDLSIKALQEFICLSRDKNNKLIQAYKDTSTKEGIANFIKVCGDLVAFPSEHAQTGDKVLPDIAKTTEDKPTGDGVVDKAVSEQVLSS